jgi:leucyl-tRNA synthetase
MRYDPKKIESKWQKKWLAEKTYEPDFRRAKKPFYNLMMFPYPSAEGLHVGNIYAFTGSDIYGRFKRMQGYDVFEPMGLDGFGIHSENYAIKIGTHPVKQAKISEKNFYRQLQMIGNGFAWDERLETYDPEYYRWTQWIFVRMFKHGLAYRKKQAVNWCPSCKTVLADEQVAAGACERCSTMVTKKELEQWFFRITKYADRLLKNLETLDWSPRVKVAQREWIGKKEGINITYPIEGGGETITVFTTRPDTNFGATFVVLAPEHPLALAIVASERRQAVQKYIAAASHKSEADRIAEGRKKTGVFTGRYALNHLTGYRMPVWVSDFVLGGFGTGAVVGVPGHDMRDFEFAQEFGLEIIRVVAGPDGDTGRIVRADQVQEEEGVMINSGFLNGMDIGAATRAVMDHMEEKGWGEKVIQYHLRDWLVSRQRYWAPPIPMIFCDACAAAGKGERGDMPGWHTAPEKSLPVKLPFVKNFRPTGTDRSPLATVAGFYKVRCPACKKWARRETDVSDVFLDSAWYYLRYPSVKNKKAPWDPAITGWWLPVARYMGGAEHSVLHLLYVRFLAMALCDAGLIRFGEPMPTFRAHGLIIKDGAKMSKSKGNVVNPDEYIRAYGADALRMYLMFLAPWEQGGDFRDAGVRGITRFLERVWVLAQNHRSQTTDHKSIRNKETQRTLHKTIKKVTEDIENLQYNTAISALMILLNAYEASPDAVSADDIKIFLKLLAPFAPHIAEEIWQGMGYGRTGKTKKGFRSIHREAWPAHNPHLAREEEFSLVVQINGKTRAVIRLPRGTGESVAVSAARADDAVRRHLTADPRKTIFVPDRLINFVI